MPPLLRRAAGSVLVTILCIAPAAADSPAREPVAVTEHFAFFSDFETNLNDRLIAAGRARRQGDPESFHSGPESACLDQLPPSQRRAWNLAVDYYAESVSPKKFVDGEQFLLRLDLADMVADDEWEPEEWPLVRIARGFRQAAAPAYETCRWQHQDQENRRWIEAITALLATHEEMLAGRLSEVYQTPWRGLPIPVDVVETVSWAGANTFLLRPPGSCHVLVSSSNPDYQGRAALEMVFHETGHYLTGRRTPLSTALAAATERLGNPFYGDLKHAVNFYLTGEVVRRRLEEVGEPDYTPALYALGLYDRGTFRSSAESTLPAYLDGERTLDEVVEDLIEALAARSAG